MSFRLIIKEEAHFDAEEAFHYYENLQPGLGERFLEALLTRFVDLAQHPQYYSHIANDPKEVLRDVKLKHFPFVVIFEISGVDEVIVYAVHNTHKQPRGKKF